MAPIRLLTALLIAFTATPAAMAAPAAAHRDAPGPDAAMVGRIRSTSDEPMEGVVVIARRAGAAVLTAVDTDASGRYEFPRDHLRSGDYTITIRATGYELSGSLRGAHIRVTATRAVKLDLTLTPVTEPERLASQLTNLEWLNSFPGTDAQKDLLTHNVVNCGFCHSMERIARSTHTAEEFRSVIQRMGTYETDHSSAERIQIATPPAPIDHLQWWGRDARDIAAYLATVNLSGGRTAWTYPLKILPRPTGKATRAIVTVFPIPRQPSVVHDLDVDAQGRVWYGNTGWDFIGRLDPATGEFKEWHAPNYLPAASPNVDRIVGVQDIQVDPDGHVWAAVGGTILAVFAPETSSWKTFEVPVVWLNPFRSPVHRGQHGIWVTGLTAPPTAGNWPEAAFHLDSTTGTLSGAIPLYEKAATPVDPAHANPFHYCYMMDQDTDGNFVCTDAGGSEIARAELQSGRVTRIPTLTPLAYPRRGFRDDHNRFWFGEFYADKIGVIDLSTGAMKEYDAHARYISPYYARPDNHGDIWVSSTGSDRLLRLDPNTGEITEYLMPVYTDARKVVVDRTAKRTTVWLPNKNTAQLIRIEVPD